MQPQVWHRWVPIFTCALGIGTLALCTGLALATDALKGDPMQLPYISYIGDDPPQYYIFIVGFVNTGILFMVTSIVHYVSFRNRYGQWSYTHGYRCVPASIPFAIFGGIGLGLLAIFNVSRYPTGHNVCVGVALGGYLIFIYLVYSAYESTWRKERKTSIPTKHLHWTVWAKRILVLGTTITVLLYGPIGSGIQCYTTTEIHGQSQYAVCRWTNFLRAISQYLLFLFALLFTGLLAADIGPTHNTDVIVST